LLADDELPAEPPLADPPPPLPLEEVPPVHAAAVRSHVWPTCVQSVHVPPAGPHALSVLPGWQTPFVSQHPEHEPQLAEAADPSSPELGRPVSSPPSTCRT
jgi:hypothetical protein